MKKVISIIICALLIVTAGFIFNNQYNKYKENKAAAAFKSKEIKFKTVKYNSGFEDLSALESILNDKKLVAIGEATHGTKEFFQMKHRMFQFLVEKMGYNVFGIEASMTDCMAINDYILYGKGDPKKVIKGMNFWTWDTKEVLVMVEWMRKYNESHIKKIKFYGFDMQFSSTAAENVTEYLKKVDAAYEVKVEGALLKFNNKELDYGVKIKLPIDEIKDIINHFEKNKDEYIEKSSKEQYELYKENLNIICEFYDTFAIKRSDYERENKRDKYMAENIKWILDNEAPDSKMMVWAHNVHVSKGVENTNNLTPDYQEGNVKRMGSNLYDICKDEMYVIGFEFGKGSFRANFRNKKNGQMVNGKCTLGTVKSGSAADIFSKVDSLFFIDFKTCEEDKDAKNILSTPQSYHEIGAVFSDENNCYKSEILDVRYDGLIFVDTTNSAEPNHR